MERGRVGLNLATLIHFLVLDPGWAVGIAKRAGFAFGQAIPARTSTAEGLRRAGLTVLFAERAWNATTLLRHLRKEPGVEGMPTLWQDVLFFPNPRECEKVFWGFVANGAVPVVHHAEQLGEQIYGRPCLVEVHPNMGLTTLGLFQLALRKNGRLCLDLRHLRRPAKDGGVYPLGRWNIAIALLHDLVDLVHVQAIDAGEASDFIAGNPTELAEMLTVLKRLNYQGPYVVELDLRMVLGGVHWLSAKKVTETLVAFRSRVEASIV